MNNKEKHQDGFLTIGQVAEILNIEPHTIRFWEKNFPIAKPSNIKGGRRSYKQEELAIISKIKYMLHDEGLTIKELQELIKQKGKDFINITSSKETNKKRLEQALLTLNKLTNYLKA